ncbi:DUF2851 family protein [Maribacter thermophilus]|uniref:DUF2851 family protein n=1 Tax=Maribacter thermophilus TaxID=1197874 RepID=UPI000640E166|nr:DUF2851 family protein [Maribacter thermophilus]
MREDLLHYIWKFKKFPSENLKTVNGEYIRVQDVGRHNQLSGPDFFNAQLIIDRQLWAGNVEIHVKSSDWYAHNHQKDSNYDNVILHVVWEDDISVYRLDRTEIPTLELKSMIDQEMLDNYQKLFKKSTSGFINCGNDINVLPEFSLENWKERLYFERLEQKSNLILSLLKKYNNDWEKVLFVLLLKNFGSKVNGDCFYQLGLYLDFSVVRHFIDKPFDLESILFGLAGLLDKENLNDSYYTELKNNYAFYKAKYRFDEMSTPRAAFFKLRPSNFPTIRLSQFAALYANKNNLFQELMSADDDSVYKILNVNAGNYWNTHYTFGKTTGSKSKRVSKKFIDLMIINTIVPLRFCYNKYKGEVLNESFFNIIQNIKKEDNSIVDNYVALGLSVKNAKDSQAILQLYDNYCNKNKCLQCAVGTKLLNLKS